jgi:hypothetical protein
MEQSALKIDLGMEIMFNELSIAPAGDKYTANSKLMVFAEAVNEARKKGFKRIRSHYDTNQIALAEGYTLFDWLSSHVALFELGNIGYA